MKFWCGVVTDRVRESKEFYVRVFGCQVLYEGEDDWFVLLQLGTSELGFMRPALASQPAIFRPAFNGQGVWIAVDVADVDAEYARIKSLRLPIELELRDEPWGDRHFVIVDPNGVGIDVVQHRHVTDAPA
ncbi:MAG TPA: VOC family protein [Burkholderiaceae bacterium]|jgi:catechol 2,3-dioxygenase-like lactoylglutathione lyase family enzyme|nr:VOC family protein [Burkholderiaceae bacterium]